MGIGRSHFFQGHQNELPLVKPGVGDGEVSLPHYSRSIDQHIDIDLSGTSREEDIFSHISLDLLEPVEESFRAAESADLNHSIQKIPLRSIANGFCFVKKRASNNLALRVKGDQMKGSTQMVGTATEVRPQTEEDPLPAPAWPRGIITQLIQYDKSLRLRWKCALSPLPDEALPQSEQT